MGAACAVIVAGVYVVTRSDDDSNRTPPVDSNVEGTFPPTTSPVDDGDKDDSDGELPSGPGSATEPPLIDRVDATIEPNDTAQIYTLPEPTGVDTPCPSIVEVALALTRERTQPLRLDLLVGGAVIDESVATTDQQAVGLPLDYACNGLDDVTLVVSPVEPLADPVSYALERHDTY